jgi:diguanylate cyclase (GGDEF)-like protein
MNDRAGHLSREFRPWSSTIVVQRAIFVLIISGLHGLWLACSGLNNAAGSSLIIALCAAMATVAAFIFAARGPANERFARYMFAIGLLLWVGGCCISAYITTTTNSALVADASSYPYFLYGIPILIAFSVPEEEHESRTILLLCAVQAVVIAYLIFIFLYSDTFFYGNAQSPISTPRLMTVFNVENIWLAVAALVRLLAAGRREERRTYGRLALFLCVYYVCAAIYNGCEGESTAASYLDVLAELPFVIFTALILIGPARKLDDNPAALASPIARSISSSSPVLLTFSILALAGLVASNAGHVRIGIVAATVALVCYIVQAIVLQAKYLAARSTLMTANAELALVNQTLARLSTIDGLTGIANRRAFDERLGEEINTARRYGHSLSLLLIDIDFFKSYNDTYGHVAGDDCLRRVATTLSKHLPRSLDVVARYGGEEFAVILPDTTPAGAQAVGEMLCAAVRDLQIVHDTGTGPFLTISLGQHTYVTAKDAGVLVEHADRALYEAKQNGRNRLVRFQ